MNDKIQVNEVLTLLCENAVLNNNESNIDQVHDVPEEVVMESEDVVHTNTRIEPLSYNESIHEVEVDQKERKYSTFSYLDDSRENSLTKINEINDTLNKLQPIISVGRFSKNFEKFVFWNFKFTQITESFVNFIYR